ncbi:hypothetical protein P879_03527 [Paragonimus westermani]|uniref:Regulator of G-protein signaling n=1 Tax=Paragonimus westermani TaxID=34504 RepID=A0A8T0DTP7_9TREM|nr:hypothetical protein P879_03527 [Paragonimus westermani]
MSVPTSIKRVLLQRDVFGYGFALKNEHPCEVDLVMPNSVADLANVRCGDVLLSINGVSVINSSHDQISSHIWSSGSPVEFEFLESNSGSMTSVSSNDRQSTRSQTIPQSPLFLGHSTDSQHKRYAMVTFVDKLRLHPQMDIRPKQLIQKLLPIKRKADQLVNEPTNSNSICLFEVHSDYLRIRMLSKTLEFSSSDLSFAGHFDEDRRFFYMITHGKHRVPCSARSTTERPGPAVVTTSCCLFRCLPPALLGHRSHLQLTNQFLISCHRDRLTGDCSEFPRSVVPLVSDLLDLINRPINTRTRLAESPIACGRVYPKPLRTSSTCTMGPPRQRRRGASSELGTATPVCSAVPIAIKKSATMTKTPSARLFNKLAKAAGYLRDRWLDRRNSSYQSPITPYERSRKTFAAANRNVSVQPPFPLAPASSHQSSPLNRPYFLSSFDEPSENSLVHLSSCSSIVSTTSRESATYTTAASIHSSQFDDFDTLLSDPIGVEAFRAFLASEFSAENIEFWCSARKWRIDFPTVDAIEEAKRIFHTFLDVSSINSVNVDENAVKQAAGQLVCPTRDIFLEAEKQVYRLMKTDCYPRYLLSDFHRSLLSASNASERFQLTPTNSYTITKSKRAKGSPVTCGASLLNQTRRMSLKSNCSNDSTSVSKLSSTRTRKRSSEIGAFVAGSTGNCRVLRDRSNLDE